MPPSTDRKKTLSQNKRQAGPECTAEDFDLAEITQRILEHANDLVIERLVNSLAARATSVDPEEAL
ncbi:hypothetical protein ANCDUO_09921 [Ancylostoma duodenale]|uniref:Uncharacterized protein n=1 Tax=Ancylostoma duodenale TaxID=51022 RepID=A0A0C2DBN2_9BILA|nr:hypothetical protein ANCDUO_09921 [Ancylostoma duodenale]